MEDEHGDHWREFLSFIEEKDLSSSTVLDFGCNQGGMLRMLFDSRPFASAVGVDLAQRSIAVAESRKGSRPIRYEATTSIHHFQDEFDLATSSAVIYLVKDMEQHAEEMFGALKPGGVYYASHPDYPSYPNFEQIKEDINRFAAVPLVPHTLDGIASAFDAAGFEVGIKRVIPQAFVELNPRRSWHSSVAENIEASYSHGYVFRLAKPAAGSAH
ncbi:MAG: methyltransferase domain-containing protein [Acidobacteriota bacterium]